MKTTKILAICSAAMFLLSLAGCNRENSESETSQTAPLLTTAHTETTEAAEVKFTKPSDLEEAVTAKAGDAFLAVADAQWLVQYFGSANDLLAYDAKTVKIAGNGKYTVGVTAESKGCRYERTGNTAGNSLCEGLSFAAVQVVEGKKRFPNLTITVDAVRVNGKKIELTAKNYTCSDDGIEMRTNLCNPKAKGIPEDAHSVEGTVSPDSAEYAAVIVNPEDFAEWSRIEVDFTVTGCNTEAEVTTQP